MSKEKLNLAIDSGATTASWALFKEPGRPHAAGKTGGVNYTGQGRKGLEALFALLAGNMDPRCIKVIGLAMAGAGRKSVRAKALDDLKQILPSSFPEASLYLFHDGEAALWRTLGKGVGIVVSSGTGSIAFGIDDEGRRMRSGGWGPIAGDEGSAYWISVQAVSHILRSFDGREPKTDLEGMVLRKTVLDSPADLVEWLHTGEEKKKEIASLSKTVSEAAEAGIQIAFEILEEAGKMLASLVSPLLKSLIFKAVPKVGMTGTVLTHSSMVRGSFEAQIKILNPRIEPILASLSPEAGASLLLSNRIESGDPPDLVPRRS